MPAQGPSQRHAEGFTTHGAGRQHEQGAERSEDAGLKNWLDVATSHRMRKLLDAGRGREQSLPCSLGSAAPADTLTSAQRC